MLLTHTECSSDEMGGFSSTYFKTKNLVICKLIEYSSKTYICPSENSNLIVDLLMYS